MRTGKVRVSSLVGEEGFSLVETVAGLTILAIGFVALAGAMTTGSRLLVQSKQRQAATEEANARLEAVRDIPYDRVALTSTPAHVADTADPDYWIHPTEATYDYDHDGAYEDLLADTTAGFVDHLPGTVTVGSTELTVYQYVTWVNDPDVTGTQDYKRVVVVVTFDAGANQGRSRSVQVSGLLTSGTVTVPGSGSQATQGSPAPSGSATPSPSPSPTGSCDTPGGDFTILSGSGAQDGFTASQNVTISLAPTGACTPISIRLSNDGTTWGTSFSYDPNSPSVTWTLTAGDGTKDVYAEYSDTAGTASVVGPHSVILDSTPPTKPTDTLTKSPDCQGNDRTVTLSWGTSTDANFLGYRVYRNVNSGGWVALKTVSTSPTTDTHLKTLNSVEFKVVAYDKAGNEGEATNVVSLAKNECS